MKTAPKRIALCAIAGIAAALLIGTELGIDSTQAQTVASSADTPVAVRDMAHRPSPDASWQTVLAGTSQ